MLISSIRIASNHLTQSSLMGPHSTTRSSHVLIKFCPHPGTFWPCQASRPWETCLSWKDDRYSSQWQLLMQDTDEKQRQWVA